MKRKPNEHLKIMNIGSLISTNSYRPEKLPRQDHKSLLISGLATRKDKPIRRVR